MTRPAAALASPAAAGTALAVAVALASTLPAAAQTPPPNEDWRQFSSDHFVVTYPAGLEPLARRAALHAEGAHAQLTDRFGAAPAGPIQLLLTDHADIANGYATPFPYNQITVFARPPMDGGSISYFDDWLKLVVAHELVHAFHFDMVGRPGKVLRTVFGRFPGGWPGFPSASTPTWMSEGLATYFESQLTDAGRTRGTWQEMVVRAAALEGALPALDRVSGSSPAWPAGNRPYVYGARYLARMAELHGEASLGAFARSTAGLWVPFRLNAAARAAFGATVAASWQAWREEAATRYAAQVESLAEQAPITEGETVDGAGWRAFQPVASKDGRALAFIKSDGVSRAHVRLLEPGERAGPAAARTLVQLNGSGGTLSWDEAGNLYFTQLEFADPYRLTGDLYRASPNGAVERVTRGLRISHADVSSAGDKIVAVQEGGGTNALATVDPTSGEAVLLVPPDPSVHWAFPRWSPDGRRIAAVRWTPSAMMDIVVLAEDGQLLAELTRDRAVDTTPFWTPDGSAVIWSSDRTGVPNLFAAPAIPAEANRAEASRPLLQVTNVAGGAAHPSVDPDARWIYFSSYHADGWHVERIPFDSATWFPPQPTSPRFAVESEAAEPASAPDPLARAADGAAGGPARNYRARSTVRPWYWLPSWQGAQTGLAETGDRVRIVPVSLGVLTGGSDLVGRHEYSTSGRLSLDGQRFAGSFRYNWRGLGNPVLGLTLGQSHDASARALRVRRPTEDHDAWYFLMERERRALLSASFLRQRVNSFAAATTSGGLVRESLSLVDADGVDGPRLSNPPPERTFAELRTTLSASTARRQPFSLSREGGVSAFVSGRVRHETGVGPEARGVPGGDRSFREVVGEAAAYKALGGPGFANHVLALRVSAGTAFGPGANRFHFEAGGAEGAAERVTGFGLFGGSSLLFPARGFPENARHGRTAWSASAEYRFPLALVDRGLGPFPLYFDRLHGSAFVDLGNAWGPGDGFGGPANPRRAALVSAGAELSAIVVPLYGRSLAFRAGVGVPVAGGSGARFHIRLGNAF